MAEFFLQRIVDNILQHLGGGLQPAEIVDYLQSNLNLNSKPSCSGIQTSNNHEVKKLIGKISNPEPFLAKYNELKEKNVDSLNEFILLLNKIQDSSGLKDLLAKSRKKQYLMSSHTNFTKEDLPLVKKVLKEKTRQPRIQDDLTHIANISNNANSSIASITTWAQKQPNMSHDFATTFNRSQVAVVPDISMEHILMDDLLSCLIGMRGCYIKPEELQDPHGTRTFKINGNVPIHLQELVKLMLPLASDYSMIQRFIEDKRRFEVGQINNALGEAMESLTDNQMLFAIELESELRKGTLSLQQIWFYCQNNLCYMRIAADIAFIISKSDAKGGKVLSILHHHVTNSIGNERTHELCLKLTQAASLPYMTMLSRWIYMGVISDPIGEFLVEDNEVIQKEEMPIDYSADYWDKKYAIRRDRIPTFLEHVADKILKTGKYLNVIRQCGKPVNKKPITIEYKIEEKHYIEAIEKAYVFSSQTLLNLVLKEEDLIGRLKSVKHYFLLDKGDFIVTFFTLCERELSKAAVDVVQVRLENLMDLALRMSSTVSDCYKEDLKIELLPFNLQYQMYKILSIETKAEKEYRSHFNPKELTVIESFTFNYEVHWPLSLILNKKSLACYQMIFRYLFYSKYVERLLCQVWKSNKVAKKFHSDDARQYRPAFILRQKMLHCVQNLQYHMMVEVIEPHWCTFIQKINKAQNVDEILIYHGGFLDNCLKDCMLTIPDTLTTIVDILNISLKFSKFMQRMQRYFIEAELGSMPNSFYESFIQSEVTIQVNPDETNENLSFNDRINQFDKQFLCAIRDLLVQIEKLTRTTSEYDRLFNLLSRLNFNFIYTNEQGVNVTR